MKIPPILRLAAFLSFIATASAASKFDAVVVGERFAARQSDPTTYALIDGGYLEAGDATAGEKPPSREVVSAALQHAMKAAKFALAKGTTTPAELVICHWGLIREDSTVIRRADDIDANYRERLSLVATPKLVQRIAERTTNISSGNAREVMTPDEQTALELAGDPRYFVVISAYDMTALVNRQVRLRWRTRISVAEKDAAMFEAVPTMLAAGAKFLAQTTQTPEIFRATLPANDRAQPAPTRPTNDLAMSSNVASLLPPAIIRELVLRERDLAAGKKSPRELGI